MNTKQEPQKVKTVIKAKATKQLQLELNFELEDDSEELSVAKLREKGLLDVENKAE